MAEKGTINCEWLDLSEDYTGFSVQFPYIRIQGARPGKCAVITAGIHGDELNGIRIIQEVQERIDPAGLRGQLMLLPIVNIYGFHILSRYLPDRRDLNRLFPGSEKGSEGARLAHFIWENFVEMADFGIDLHSASYDRWNFPHLRGDMTNEKVRELARAFAAPISLHSTGVSGSLRREATNMGVPFVLLEAGECNRFEEKIAAQGLAGVMRVLYHFDMIDELPDEVEAREAESYYKKSYWIRAPVGGLFYPRVKAGSKVIKGQKLAEIKSLMGEVQSTLVANRDGSLIGYNLHPQVVPGRALFHVGCEKEEL